jgi:acyl phosphate:glycerol-3-phosphate acyltransferase
MRPLLVIIIAYLLGSIPFGYLVVWAKERTDVRQTGSGGTGATNVSRRAGKGAGVLTLMLDALKGTTAVIVARLMSDPYPGLFLAEGGHAGPHVRSFTDWWVAAAAVAVILGHIFPIWLGFRGGKGVATGVGVFLVLAPLAVVLAGAIFALIVWLTRYVSLGSIVAALTLPFLIWFEHVYFGPFPDFAPLMTAASVGTVLIVFAHRENIARLIKRTESQFG